jgi:hypothetical protein
MKIYGHTMYIYIPTTTLVPLFSIAYAAEFDRIFPVRIEVRILSQIIYWRFLTPLCVVISFSKPWKWSNVCKLLADWRKLAVLCCMWLTEGEVYTMSFHSSEDYADRR